MLYGMWLRIEIHREWLTTLLQFCSFFLYKIKVQSVPTVLHSILFYAFVMAKAMGY
jgi:hypothetical protein